MHAYTLHFHCSSAFHELAPEEEAEKGILKFFFFPCSCDVSVLF